MHTNNHVGWLQKAIDLATENVQLGGGPFACIIVKDGVEVGRGVNKVTTNCDPTAHAEVQAIRDACKNLGDYQLTDCVLYTSCEPCPMCFGAIYWARPKEVYYAATHNQAATAGFDDSFIYKEIQKSDDDRNISWQRLSLSNCESPFLAWMKKIDKKAY